MFCEDRVGKKKLILFHEQPAARIKVHYEGENEDERENKNKKKRNGKNS